MALLSSDYLYPSGARHQFYQPFAGLFHRATSDDPQVSRNHDQFSLAFNTAAQFKSGELEVHIVGDTIIVEGNHSSESENGSLERHFRQKFRIPADVDAESVQSALDPHGILTVSAKIKKPMVAGDENDESNSKK